MQSQADTRRDVNLVMSKVVKVEEDIKEVREFSQSAARKVKAEDMKNADVASLGLKWESVEQIRSACENPEKKLAVLRLLNSGMISSDKSHVVSSALKYFINSDLLRRLCIKLPPG